MQKATLAEAGILILSGGIAANLGLRLAQHNVGVAAIAATITFALTTGMYFAFQVGQGIRTSVFTCPTKGCDVTIRAKNTSTNELNSLRAMATDHSKHGGAR